MTIIPQQPESELIALEGNPFENFNAVVALENPHALDVIVSQIEKKVQEFVPDFSTAKGLAEAKSFRGKIRKSKTFVRDKMLEEVKRIKSVAAKYADHSKQFEERMDGIYNLFSKEIEDAESFDKKRKEGFESSLAMIAGFSQIPPTMTAEEIKGRIAMLAANDGIDWQEYKDKADAAKKKATDELCEKLNFRIAFEETQLENERLRKEAEARAVADEKNDAGKAGYNSAGDFQLPGAKIEPPAATTAAAPVNVPPQGAAIPPAPNFGYSGMTEAERAAIKNEKREKALAAFLSWFAVHCPVYENDVKAIFHFAELGEIPHLRLDVENA